MLTENEKNRIRLEEEYRDELRKEKYKQREAAKKKEEKPKTFMDRLRIFFDWFDGPSKLLQTLAIATGILLTVQQYSSNSKSERAEAAREYQKSYYEAQMAVYAEAVNETATLSTVNPDSQEYAEARKKFFQLFWGRMSMFEDKCVESKMTEFRRLLIKFEQQDFKGELFVDPCSSLQCRLDTVTQVTLKKSSLRLAHQCRVYTIKTWLPPEEQLKYNVIDTSSSECPSKN
jgi:hypothetical protein